MIAITALCLFGFHGITQGQALAGSNSDTMKKTPLVAFFPASDDVKGDGGKK